MLDGFVKKIAIYQAAGKIRLSQSQDTFLEHASWQKIFVLLPRRCYVSNRWLWLTWALRARTLWPSGSDYFPEDRYYAKDQGLWMLVKNVQKK